MISLPFSTMTSFACERDSADLSMNSLPLSAISLAALVTAFLISSIEPVEFSTTDLAFSAVSSILSVAEVKRPLIESNNHMLA